MGRTTGTPAGPLGIVGEGHLARQLVIAAREQGVEASLIPLAEVVALRSRRDAGAVARKMSEGLQGVLLATEHCPVESVHALERHVAVMPGAAAIGLTQDRAAERAWLERHGLRTVAWVPVHAEGQLVDALRSLGGEAYLKPCRRGAETGRPVYVRRPEQAVAAWVALGSPPAVLEEVAAIELELTVLVVRGAAGEVVTYPPVLSQRHQTQLQWSVMPAPVPREIAERAAGMARTVAEKLPIVGAATLELFWMADGRLAVNEVVAGPHLAHCADTLAYATGQAAQAVRVARGLPPAPVRHLRPAASAPITGDLWADGRVPGFDELRGMSGIRVAFYGDRPPEPGRVHGHVAATAATADEAVSLLLAALRRAAVATERAVTRPASTVPAR